MFHSFHAALAQLTTLAYHNPDKIFWINLNALKEFDFGAMLFHTRTNEELRKRQWPSCSAICPIIFFSRLLTPAEKNYWPTKLEIASFVWVIKKVRHVVKSFQAKVIV